MTKKKICMIVPSPWVKGGIAAVTSGYYKSRLNEDFNVRYVQSYCDGNKIKKLIKALSGYILFIYELIFHKPDIVHIHSSFGASFYRKKFFIDFATFKNIPVINHIHGADFYAFFLNASEKKKVLIKNTYKKCSTIIALSDEWKEKLSLIVPTEKIEVIPNYSTLHPEAFECRKKETKLINILFLGELGHRKGTYDIPLIAEKLLTKGVSSENINFIIAGVGSKEDENNIHKLISSKNIADMFVFPGWVRDKTKDTLLKKANIFLLPSYNEGMPMSILDACGYGLPIVSTNVGGIPKIIDNGITGYICVPGDIDEFADKLYKLITDEALRISMGIQSYEKIKNDYSLEKHISQIEIIWNKY